MYKFYLDLKARQLVRSIKKKVLVMRNKNITYDELK